MSSTRLRHQKTTRRVSYFVRMVGILLLGGCAACALRTLGSQPLSYTEGTPSVPSDPPLVRFPTKDHRQNKKGFGKSPS